MQFTHEHLEIQKTLKRFIDEEINPHVDEWEAAEIFPAHQVFKRLGELGLLGLTKPEEYGGAGLDYSYAMAMAEALGHIECGGVPMAIGVQTDMATPALARFGSDELRARVPGAGHRRRHGGLHRRERARRRQRRGRHQEPGGARTATTTSSPARRCGSPTACRPTGCACWSTPAKGPSTRTSRW